MKTPMTTDRLLAVVRAPVGDQRTVALAYAKASREHSADFARVNAAIEKRYGLPGLVAVKKAAAGLVI